MIKTKKELIKRIQKIGNQKIEQGIQFRNLAGSIENEIKRGDKKTLKEWVEFTQKILNLDTDRHFN